MRHNVDNTHAVRGRYLQLSDGEQSGAASIPPNEPSPLDDSAKLLALAQQANRPDPVAELQRRGNPAPSAPHLVAAPGEAEKPLAAPAPPPPTALAITQVGASLLEKGQVAAAVEKLRYAIELDANQAEAHANLGVPPAQLSQLFACESRLSMGPFFLENYILLEQHQGVIHRE